MTENSKTVSVRVTGRVQGVSYRAWTQEQARALGLAGWVRNEPDGSVSALLDGPAGQVDAMLSALQAGPPQARVDSVEATNAVSPQAEPGFVILR